MSDEPTLDLEAQLIAHQREAEINFAACSFMFQGDLQQGYGWLSPENLLDLEIKSFWQKILVGDDVYKAAIDAGIFNRLGRRVAENNYYPSELNVFAQVISEDVYLRKLAVDSRNLAKAINERSINAGLDAIRQLAQEVPSTKHEYPKAVDAHIDFMIGLEDDPQVIYTGISNLDLAMGGLERRTMNMLAARPSMGKTAAAYQIAEHNAEKGLKALYISPEMNKRQLWMRRVCGLAGVESRVYKAGKLTDEQKRQMADISGELVEKYGNRLTIIDTAPITMQDIWQAASEVRPDILIVDHMGLIYREHKNEVSELGELSWQGKVIAKQFNCASLFLYQINRDAEKRDNKRPSMSDLRGSGEIEQNIDTCSFLYRDDYYEDPIPGQTVSKTEWIIDKNRDGARNVRVNLNYHLKKQAFFPIEPNAQTPKGR